MSAPRQRRLSDARLAGFAALSGLFLFVASLVVVYARGDADRRFAKVRTGDVRVLEPRVPVRRVSTSDASIVATRMDPVEGLVLVARKAGTAEVRYERADGQHRHWVVAVREAAPIPISFVRPRNNAPRVARRRPKDDDAQRKAEARRLAVRPKPKPQPKPPELKEVKPSGQVVQIAPPARPQRPDKAKFLSEFDSKVEQETQARIKSPKSGRPGAPAPLALPAPRTALAPKPPTPKKPAPGIPAQPTKTTPPVRPAAPKTATAVPPEARPKATAQPAKPNPPSVADAKAPASLTTPSPLDPSGEKPKTALAPTSDPAREPAEPNAPGAEPNEGALTLPPGQRIDLAPSADVLQRALRAGGGGQGGGQAFPDRLKGIKEGDNTFLNTKEWKGASFFNRVKAAVAQKWNPAEVYARRDPQGDRYGIKDRYTGLHVTLNGDGSLRHLRVSSPSGVDFLDEEAVGAFEAAQPFPNPPDAVKDKDGLIRFSFGFYFEVSDKPLLRITR